MSLCSIQHTKPQVNTPNTPNQAVVSRERTHAIEYLKGLSDCTYLTAEVIEQPETVAKKPGQRKKINLSKIITAVRGIEVYASTVVVKRHSQRAVGGGERTEIMNLSSDSLGRLAFVAFNTPADFRSMITLTYPGEFSNDGRRVKCDLDTLLKWYRRNFPGALYLWWLEFQKRGAPHFHVISTVDLATFGKLATIKRKSQITKIRKPYSGQTTWLTHWDTWKALEQAWERLGGGLTAWEVINDQEGGKKYAAKYATKAYQKAVPSAYRNVGRFWGCSQEGVKPEPQGFYECTEEQLRAALERGGWDHLPNESEVLYRELFQAAQAIDLADLSPMANLEPTVYPKLTRPISNNGYVCLTCGGQFEKWAGQCPACGEWNTLSAKPVVAPELRAKILAIGERRYTLASSTPSAEAGALGH